LFYTSVERAFVIEAFNGFGYTMAELVLMDLAVRATPKGNEGLGFSLMMSVRNLALFGTDALGSALMEKYKWSLNTLVMANAATTALAIPLVFLLPRAILAHADSAPVAQQPIHGGDE
jgi:predicted MFS family arabinose efflux permease